VALVSLSYAIGQSVKVNVHLPSSDDLVFPKDGWYETVIDVETGRFFTYYAGPDVDLDGEGGSAFAQIHQLLRDDE
jgi:hypothetical protein